MVVKHNQHILEVSTNKEYKVVEISPSESKVFLFECSDNPIKGSFPRSYDLEDVYRKLESGKFTIVEKSKFSKRLGASKIQPTDEKYAKYLSFYLVIIGAKYDALLHGVPRWQIIKLGCKNAGVSTQTGMNWLKLMFAYGINIDSILPNHENCGKPGEDRPSDIPPRVRNILTSGYKRLHLGLGLPLWDTLKQLKLESRSNAALLKEYKVSTTTLRYYGEKAYSKEERERLRHGEINFKNNKRILRGTAKDMVLGACHQYQIDTTRRDIRVVASFDRNLFISNPTFFVITDVASSAIIGVYITLDPPSYESTANAIYVALNDKTLLYKNLGLSLKHLTFNPHGVPFEILSDRAREFLMPISNQLIHHCGITSIGNTPRRSPKQKGNVETLINLIQKRVKMNFLNRGQTHKNEGERFAVDSKKQATVTLEELYKITLITVNEYNTKHVLRKFKLTAEMLAAKVKKRPADIYNWLIENEFGRERHADPQSLWYALLKPRNGLAIHKEGLRIDGRDYVPVSDDESDLLQTLRFKRKKVDVIFDPTDYRKCFWCYQGKQILLRTRGKYEYQFLNEWEAQLWLESSNETDDELVKEQHEAELENDEEINSIIDKAAEKQQEVRSKGSKKGKAFQRALNKQKNNQRNESYLRKSSNQKPTQTQKKKPAANSRWLKVAKQINH